jgi:hypothetical protein
MENNMTNDQANVICKELETIGLCLAGIESQIEFIAASQGSLSRRDQFAIAAMQAIIAEGYPPRSNCIEAYKYADLMIEQSRGAKND